ncbi:hypothetical protein AOQ84DRAFT_267558, partial [Glonium stellatum]
GAVFYGLSTMFTKISILLFYLGLSPFENFRIAAYLVMVVTVGYCLTGAFGFLFFCRPIRKYWNVITPGSCVNIGATYLANATLNVATDITLLFLPIWMMWGLRMPILQKLGITAILMAGSFVCVASIIRLELIPSGLADPDTTWRYVINLIWCIIEMYTGIICACLPIMKPFARRF